MAYEEYGDGDIIDIPPRSNINVACCDCGLVHQFVNIGDESTKIVVKRQSRRTGQMRRHGNGNLFVAGGRWMLVRC